MPCSPLDKGLLGRHVCRLGSGVSGIVRTVLIPQQPGAEMARDGMKCQTLPSTLGLSALVGYLSWDAPDKVQITTKS
jgi:hypothetical protein